MNDEQLYTILLNYYQDIQDGITTWGETSEKLLARYNIDKTGNALRKWFHRRYAGEVGIEDDVPVIVNVSTEEDDVTLEDVIWSRSNLNPDEWILDKFWGSLDKPQATFKRRQISTENVLDLIIDKIGGKNWNTPQKVTHSGSHLFIPALFDAHVGKPIKGDIEDLYFSVLYDVLNKATSYAEIGQVLFPLGQDFGHIDNTAYTTTAGTPQEVNGTYAEIIATQVSIAVKAVDFLAQSFPIHVQLVPGNHDRFSNSWLGHVVEQRFKGHPNVTVDNSALPRKYFRWGKTLIMSTHGNEESLATIGNLISTESRKDWGQTEYCEVLVGHLHTRKEVIVVVDEKHGIIIRYMPSISDLDSWHRLKGYVNNARGGMGLVYSDLWGFEGMHLSSLDKFL